MPQQNNDRQKNDLFLTRRIRGFTVVLSHAHSNLVDSPEMEHLLANACRYSMEKRKNGKPSVLADKLPGNLPVHIKYWQPRREHHRVKTLWKPSRPERAGRQHVELTCRGLPVPDLIMYGYRKLPAPQWGLYLVGITVTRLEKGTDLRELLAENKAPWERNHAGVLRQLAHMLAELHEAGFVHGDFMLKNVLYCPERAQSYLLTDLESGWKMPSDDAFGQKGRGRDLFRMVVSLARNGFSKEEIVTFLRAYDPAEGTLWHAGKAEAGLQNFLGLRDRRALELARWLRLRAIEKHLSFRSSANRPQSGRAR